MASGRPRESSVWDYFEFNEEENKSVCIVEVGDCQNEPKLCGIKIAGKYPTNLRKHLKKFHKKEHQDMEKKEREKEEAKKVAVGFYKKNKSPTPTIESCIQGKNLTTLVVPSTAP